MVDYFEIDGFPGKYFSCARYGTMSTNSCSKNFAAAPVAVKSGRLEGCVGCQIGENHSGIVLKPATSTSAPVTTRQACLRCQRSGGEDDSRLIGRMRLVRGHTICVSCYNREREVIQGANAKGAKPKKWSGLFYARTAYRKENKIISEKTAAPVMGYVETVRTALRQTGAAGMMYPVYPAIPLKTKQKEA